MDLLLIEGVVAALERHEFRVGALFDGCAPIHYQNSVGILNCAQAVGNKEHRATTGPGFEIGANLLLGVIIQRTGRLIQDEETGIVKNCAGDRDPLPLPSRQRRPPVRRHGCCSPGANP